jgi:hypothetical protein
VSGKEDLSGGYLKYMEERERKRELEALFFKTINRLKKGRRTGRLLFGEFLMGSMC